MMFIQLIVKLETGQIGVNALHPAEKELKQETEM